jgi:hypothetical protein
MIKRKKMKKFLIPLLVVIVTVTSSCDSGGHNLFPLRVKFVSPVPGRAVNLQKTLGKEFLVIRDLWDTLGLSVIYDKKKHINHLIETDGRDTLFSGKVSRYQGVFFFSMEEKDSTYQIFVVKIKKDSIKCLDMFWFQLAYLSDITYDYLHDKPGDYGDLGSMIVKVSKDTGVVWMAPRAPVLRFLYQPFLDESSFDRLIIHAEKKKEKRSGAPGTEEQVPSQGEDG